MPVQPLKALFPSVSIFVRDRSKTPVSAVQDMAA